MNNSKVKKTTESGFNTTTGQFVLQTAIHSDDRKSEQKTVSGLVQLLKEDRGQKISLDIRLLTIYQQNCESFSLQTCINDTRHKSIC